MAYTPHRLHAQRLMHGVTRKALGEKLGLDEEAVRRLEEGEAEITETLNLQLIDILGSLNRPMMMYG